MTTQDKIKSAIKTLPKLGISGIYHARLKRSLEEEQELLLASVDSFEKVYEWLQRGELTKIKKPNTSSYYLKHLVEHDTGYVANGVFVAAAVNLDYPFKAYSDNPNVNFGISKRSLKSVQRRQKYTV